MQFLLTIYNNDCVLAYFYVYKIVSVFNFFQIIIECLRGCFFIPSAYDFSTKVRPKFSYSAKAPKNALN